MNGYDNRVARFDGFGLYYAPAPAERYWHAQPLALAEALAYEACAERAMLDWTLTHAFHHDLAGLISVNRFSRRDDWMAFDVRHGRDDARYLGLIPGVFVDPATAPIF